MFTQSWEDPACDLAALAVQPGETIFAIISGCDNVLGFLLADPARVIAVDLNPTQGIFARTEARRISPNVARRNAGAARRARQFSAAVVVCKASWRS